MVQLFRGDSEVGSAWFYLGSRLWMIVAPLAGIFVSLETMRVPLVILIGFLWAILLICAIAVAGRVLLGGRSKVLKKRTIRLIVIASLPAAFAAGFYVLMILNS